MKKNNKQSILIVDDKPANIFAIEKLLERKDRILLKAADGNEALKIAFNNHVDLIILDVNMPGIDGFEVAQLLKSNKRTKDIPIIFASAEKKEHQSILKGFEEGGIDYLFKPLDPEVTKAKVLVMLKLQMQKKELLEKNQSLEKAALLIDNSADIIGIVDTSTFKFEEVNSAFTTILGYSKEETRGMSLTFFLADEDRNKIQQIKNLNDERLSFETQVYAKDRSIKWLHWNVINKTGKWFVNARDITEVKQVEKIRNYLATVVKQSNDAVYIIDDEDAIISWNEGAQKIYSYTEEEAFRMKVWNLIPEYMQANTAAIIKRIMDGEKIISVETKRITKHGKIINVLLSSSVIIDSATKIKSVAITEKDITEQKIADEQIKQLNNELKDKVKELENTNNELESFSYSISHDLRSPLRAISGYTGMIQRKFAADFDPEVNRLFNIVKDSASQMGRLIEDLLSFSRLGRQPLSTKSVNFHSMIINVLQELNISEKYIIENKVDASVNIEADPNMLRQVFINLLSNAVKYSAKKDAPKIEIFSEQKPAEYIITVKDNGAGFDMNYADKLFGVFQRLHRENEFEGTGVGLSIAHRIITKHGGSIWAEAEVNVGASFSISFPQKS